MAIPGAALEAVGTPTPMAPAALPPVPTAAFTPVPTPVPAKVTIAASEADAAFPDSISFHLNAASELSLTKVDLEFGTDPVFSCATREISSVRMDVEPGTEVEASWDWEMKKTGSIPPGATVWWRWRFEDEEGRRYLSPRQELEWEDERFSWRSFSRDNITLYWYEGGSGFGGELAEATADGLSALELGRDLVQPIKAFVYPDAEAVQGAILFAQAWVGGLAFSSHNILLITIAPEMRQGEVTGLVHELAHLLVREVTFNCFGDMPRWLNEGLATYSEGPLASYQQSALDQAVAADDLITLRSLSSSFPAADTGATLSYAQSQSLVAYLIDTYGWERMRSLLAVFQEGSTYDGALLRVYGMDMAALDREWRSSLGR